MLLILRRDQFQTCGYSCHGVLQTPLKVQVYIQLYSLFSTAICRWVQLTWVLPSTGLYGYYSPPIFIFFHQACPPYVHLSQRIELQFQKRWFVFPANKLLYVPQQWPHLVWHSVAAVLSCLPHFIFTEIDYSANISQAQLKSDWVYTSLQQLIA